MKTNLDLDAGLCSTPVLAASTVFTPGAAAQRAEQSSLHAVPFGPGSTRRSPSMRLTDRDCQIIDLILRARALYDRQIQTALFSPGGASRCQRRLTLLYRYHFLDRLPQRAVNEPAVYLLSRRSLRGKRLLRARWGESALRGYSSRLGSVNHLLAVNEVFVRVLRGCRELGWGLKCWERPEELSARLSQAKLEPDAFFQIRRQVDGADRTASFFLELERVVKSRQVLRSKLERYAKLYYSGRYSQIFGTRGLRVLFVYAADQGQTSAHRVAVAQEEAERLGVTIARFAGLDQLVGVSPIENLTGALWTAPGLTTPSALLPGSPTEHQSKPQGL